MNTLRFDAIASGLELPLLSVAVDATMVVAGALASRDHSPLHHDHAYATRVAGHPDIFLNTPTQGALLERCVAAWAGPRARIGRLRLRMRAPVYPGARLAIGGRVASTQVDARGCGWVQLALEVRDGERSHTACELMLALPRAEGDNPWLRRADDWQPPGFPA